MTTASRLTICLISGSLSDYLASRPDPMFTNYHESGRVFREEATMKSSLDTGTLYRNGSKPILRDQERRMLRVS